MRLISALFIFFSLQSYAQESLRTLDFGANFKPQKEKRNLENENEVIYLLDTLELPFIDDFVRNRNKNVRLNPGDSTVIDSVLAIFTADGSASDTLPLRTDTTKFIIETSPGVFDTIAYQAIEVIFYDSLNSYSPIDTQYFWQTEREVMLISNLFTEDLGADTILFNKSIVCYFALDDPISYWINEGAFRNNTFGVNPPTVGVMTFDGIDRLGSPYDFSSSNTYGNADMLTSKPINLGEKNNGSPYTVQDSVYLSFHYQPQGFGNDPEIEDSLSLNYYSPVTDKWYWEWAVPGSSNQAFRRVDFHIDDTLFLQKGFRFRFRNKATLSGSLDHWNIDYVAIVANRRIQKEAFPDVGYYGETPSYIKTHTSMPWKHYKKDPSKYMEAGVQIPISNLSNIARFLQLNYNVRNLDDNIPFFELDTPVPLPNLPGKQNLSIGIPVSAGTPSFSFPTNSAERASFEIQNYFEVNPDENRDNDTLRHYQYFDTYYAYDDGVAELAYSVNGTGAKLAYEFETDVTDTLRAILVNFPRMLLNEQNRRINIMVWNDLSEEPIYESGPVWEVDYPDLNDFKRYVIDENIVVSGKYYIGWEQQDNRKIYVGWDINKRNEERLFYNLDGSWTNTSFEGSLMLRPDFGFAQIRASIEEKTPTENQFVIAYPNPAKNEVRFSFEGERANIRVYDLSGRLMLNEQIDPEESVALNGFSNGIYILKGTSSTGAILSGKLRVFNE